MYARKQRLLLCVLCGATLPPPTTNLEIFCALYLSLSPLFVPLTEIESDKDYINNTITIGTGLFELYLALQTIVR
jgi:hypothetical protein